MYHVLCLHVQYCWLRSWLIVLFNDTATTEIDTYCHSLPLHAALPIGPRCSRTSRCSPRSVCVPATRPASSTASWPARPTPTWPRKRPSGRSEEHTSELQSLMRLSYAVFCLKNQQSPDLCSSLLTSQRSTTPLPIADSPTLYTIY